MEREQLRAIRGQLENRAIGMGARFFGVADLTEALDLSLTVNKASKS
jgi:hypothetical protein